MSKELPDIPDCDPVQNLHSTSSELPDMHDSDSMLDLHSISSDAPCVRDCDSVLSLDMSDCDAVSDNTEKVEEPIVISSESESEGGACISVPRHWSRAYSCERNASVASVKSREEPRKKRQKLTVSKYKDREPHVIDDSDSVLAEITVQDEIKEEKPEEAGTSSEVKREGQHNATWPFYSKGKNSAYAAPKVAKALLNPKNVCNSVPQQCDEALSFIVNSEELQNSRDITADDNGTYRRPSTFNSYVHVNENSNAQFASKTDYDYCIHRRYYMHKGTTTFKRVIYEMFDKSGQKHPYVMLQYYFTDKIQKPIIRPGFGKEDAEEGVRPFMPRAQSTKLRVKELCKSFPPKKVVAKVQEEAGGSQHIRSISQTVRNRQQVYNLKKKIPEAHKSRSGPNPTSDFDAILKMSIGGQFVRHFELSQGGHPRAFCATGQQLQDVEKHCTGPNGSLLQIDPTFKLGPFYLTCTTFRHPYFVTKEGKHVLMPGPYMIHATRETLDYEFFGRHLSNGIHDKTITLYGSDGEKALAAGLAKTEGFANSKHLLCMLHAKDNVKKKLNELHLSTSVQQKITKHIFGQDAKGVRHTGIVDAESTDDFDRNLETCSQVWDRMEMEETGKEPRFAAWFKRNKAEDCKTGMLAPLRRKAGLGQTPKQFTTNDVEAENLNVKREFNWQRATWDSAANHLHSMVNARYEELSRALYMEGEYKLSHAGKHLEVQAVVWAAMTPKAREAHLKRANMKLVEGEPDLSKSWKDCTLPGFSHLELKEVWRGACRILETPENITMSPTDGKKFVVLDREHAHIVTKQDNYLITCDKHCSSFKYFGYLCQHTLAVADKNGCCHSFVCAVNVLSNRRQNVNKAIHQTCRKSGEKGKARKGRNNQCAQDNTDCVPGMPEPCIEQEEEDNMGQDSGMKPKIKMKIKKISKKKGVVVACSGSTEGPESTSTLPQTTCDTELPKSTPPQTAGDTAPPESTLPQTNGVKYQITLLSQHDRLQKCGGCRHKFIRTCGGGVHDVILSRYVNPYYVKGGVLRVGKKQHVYYHTSHDCCLQANPEFIASDVDLTQIPPLTPEQRCYIYQQLGIRVPS